MEIDKKQVIDYLKNHPFIVANVKNNDNHSLILLINLGVKIEKKISKSDLILKELREIKSDIYKLKDYVSILMEDVYTLKDDVSDIKIRLGTIEREAINTAKTFL